MDEKEENIKRLRDALEKSTQDIFAELRDRKTEIDPLLLASEQGEQPESEQKRDSAPPPPQ